VVSYTIEATGFNLIATQALFPGHVREYFALLHFEVMSDHESRSRVEVRQYRSRLATPLLRIGSFYLRVFRGKNNGEAGIRTLGTLFGVQRFSKA
jgi:hypothetical protein